VEQTSLKLTGPSYISASNNPCSQRLRISRAGIRLRFGVEMPLIKSKDSRLNMLHVYEYMIFSLLVSLHLMLRTVMS
jgi:hypothetical protein